MALFPRPAVRLNPAGFQGTPEPKDEPAAENPPRGAILDYVLKSAPSGPVVIEILDARGELVRRYASNDQVEPPDLQKIQVTEDWAPALTPPEASAGLHRYVWDLRYEAPKELSHGRRRETAGIWAPPGSYTVRLTAGRRTLTQPLVVRKDPRIPASDEDLQHQFELARRVEAERVRLAAALGEAVAIREQAVALAAKASGEAAAELAELEKALVPVAGPAVPLEAFYNLADAAPTSLLRLAVVMSRFQGAVESADAAPTPDAVAGSRWRSAAVEEGLTAWREFVATRLPKTNRVLQAAGLTPLRAGG